LAKRKLPILKPAEVVTRLVSLGFEEVPFPRGRDISPILLRQNARDIRVTAEELVDA
jgi:hypothetical protein